MRSWNSDGFTGRALSCLSSLSMARSGWGALSLNRLRELHQHRPVAALALSSLVALGLSNLGTRAGAQVAPPPVARFLAAQTPAAAATPVDPPGRATLFPDGLRAVWSSQDGRSVLTSTRASAGAAWGTPNRLLTTRGVVRRIVVAPDGASLAYENQRSWKGDGAPDDTWQFICVYDIPTRQISYIDPVFAVDADPVWTVDSARISFVRKVVGLPDAHLTRPVVRPRLAGWTPPPLKPSEKFTLASVIAAPFIYPPGSSADGTAIAYVTREGRARNVYFMRLGDAARRLASYPQDDGQDLSDPPALSKTGAAIAYVRGGPINRQGDAPNPTAAADMPAQQVWLVGAKDDAPRLIGPGHDPLFTPDDRYLIWQSDSLMAAPLIWRDGRLAGVGAPEEFLTGQRNGLSFSPHGGRLAYERGGGIEVYDFTAKTTVVVPHGAEIDQGPVWSPDGTRLAFRRTSANSPNWLEGSCGNYRYCGPLVSADPWSIWTVDTATLQPRKIWQAKPGVGSVFYPLDQSYSPSEHGNQLLWSGNDQIAFAWEGDGWRHLYVVSATGGEARLLTPGDGEVETAALSMDRTRIIYSANIGDLGRRHIFSVNFDGVGKPLTAGDQASQWSPLPLAGGATGYVDAGWADPPVVRVLNASGGITTAALPASPPGFPAQLLVKPTLVEFPAQDGQTAFGQMFTPEHPTGCAIIFSHGGIKRQMLPGFHYMDAYAYLYEMNHL